MAASRKAKRREQEVVGGEVPKQRPLRRRIRDARRLLSRDQLPETVRLTQERVLKSLQHELDEKLEEKRTKKVSKKYRMVKFFEKRKVTRKLRTQLKLYESRLPEDRAELEEKIARLRMELNYIVHYPEDSKYLALYPSTETTSAKGLALRENRLAATAEAVASGELPDASLELCTTSGLVFVADSVQTGSVSHHKSSAKVVKHSRSVTATSVTATKKKSGSNVKKMAAAVDREPNSDSESPSESTEKASSDDFFLDVTGNKLLS